LHDERFPFLVMNEHANELRPELNQNGHASLFLIGQFCVLGGKAGDAWQESIDRGKSAFGFWRERSYSLTRDGCFNIGRVVRLDRSGAIRET
jgi:hypothetical protein